MAKRKSKKKTSLLSVAVMLVVAVLALLSRELVDFDGGNLAVPDGDKLLVHYIDVGQGNSTLIQSGTKGVLVDGGEIDRGDEVCRYLSAVGVESLECIIATHPHSDHIGGLIEVLETYKVGKVYCPEILESNLPDTRVYENFLDAIAENGAEALYADPGKGFTFGSAAFAFLGPLTQLKDLNNMSVITKLQYGNSTFLFVGDAEIEEMETLAEMPADYSADIYLSGHHGSRTSVYEPFLKLVNPTVAVISCGVNNKYNHPHSESLEYFDSVGTAVLRTDKNGSIVFTCDSQGYTYYSER